MIKARTSGSKVYLYFMTKRKQARCFIPWISCFYKVCIVETVKVRAMILELCIYLEKYSSTPLSTLSIGLLFVSPAKQKRDTCISFPMLAAAT